MKFIYISVVLIVSLFCVSCGNNPASGSSNPVGPKTATIKKSEPQSPVYEFKKQDQKPIVASKHLLELIKQINGLKKGVQCAEKPCAFLKENLILKLPQYQSFILEGMKIARDMNMQIDLLANHHQTNSSLSGDKTEQRSVTESKLMVIALNEQINPDLMGVESCYGAQCDEPSEYKDGLRLSEDIGYPSMSRERMAEIYKTLSKDYWHVEYIKIHPDARIIGIDSYELQSSEQLIDQALSDSSVSSDQTLAIREPIIRLRSYMAFARMAHLLKEKGFTHGTITLGYMHAADFKKIGQDYGIATKIFVAIPKWNIDNFERF